VGALEPWHLIVILGIALIVFGPGKLPELGATLGKAVRDFRDASEGKIPSQSCVNCRALIPGDAKFCPGCGLEASSVTLASYK
jgi:sec-independent protein translocase protein TatA